MNKFNHTPIGFEKIYIRSEQKTKDNLAYTILNELLELYNASRAYIFYFDNEYKVQKCLYEVCAKGVKKEKDNLKEVPTSISLWWCNELKRKRVITIDNLENARNIIGDETYFLLKSQNIKSLCVSPLIHHGYLYGYIGIDKVNENYKWDSKDSSVLRAFANSFTSVLYQDNKKSFQIDEFPSFQKYLPHYLEILDTLPINIVIYSPEGFLLGANQYARSYYYLNNFEDKNINLKAKLFDYFIMPEKAVKAFYSGKSFNTEIKYLSKCFNNTQIDDQSSIFYFSCNAIPLVGADDFTNAYLFVLTDITERHLIAESLKLAKRKAEESDKLKSAFLANMSHEIRTPLNAIVGFSDLMGEAENNEERKMYSNIINNNTDLLLCLINDILDLSKIESGVMKWNMERCDFVPYFDELAMSFKRRIDLKNIDFIVDNPCESCIINFDKIRFTQAVTNYVTNAIKYTKKGYIKLGYRIKDKGIEVYVSDTGIGIAESKKSKVFKRFEKLDQFAKGNGLGLSITKGLIENVGGKVYFESKKGIGSTFYIWRPCENMVYIEKKVL